MAKYTMADLRRLCDECGTAEEARRRIVETLGSEVRDYETGLAESLWRCSGILTLADGPDGERSYAVSFGPPGRRPIRGREFGHGDTAEVIRGGRLSCLVGRLACVG